MKERDGSAHPDSVERLFYDGHCGLCHGAVLFVVKRDPDGTLFRFAPLEGETFQREVSKADQTDLPDSIVIRTSDGRLLTRSTAALHIGSRLGSLWRLLAAIGRLVPRPLRDAVYDGIARVRHRLFAAPPDVCPLLPAHLRGRFDP